MALFTLLVKANIIRQSLQLMHGDVKMLTFVLLKRSVNTSFTNVNNV